MIQVEENLKQARGNLNQVKAYKDFKFDAIFINNRKRSVVLNITYPIFQTKEKI